MLAFLRKLRLPRSRQGRIAFTAAAVPIAIFFLALAIYGVDRVMHGGQGLRGVEFAGESLAGLDEDGMRAAVERFEDTLVATPALFTVNDREFALDPLTIGFSIDTEAVIAEAMAVGRIGGPLSQFGDWLGSFGSTHEVAYSTDLDAAALELTFDQWESDAIEVGVFDGAISVRDTEVIAEYPQRGLAIERVVARDLVTGSLASTDRRVLTIPLTVLEPSLIAADIDAAAEEARLLIGSTVVLAGTGLDELRAEFTTAQLAGALRSGVSGSPAQLDLWFDPAVIDGYLDGVRAELELPPRDAEFRINDDETVTLIPSRPGTLLDPQQVAVALVVVAKTSSRQGELPIVDGVEPDFTTEEAEAMGPIIKVSEFTTNHACCEGRVTNIQRFADLLDGRIIQPGEEFSLNEAVGRRTTEDGFVAAPMIREGELVPDIGGGVSQFATTFYNAVFFGGYQDITHIPHSTYISRYPELREATISWPAPDLVFRNDSDAIIIIDTWHTDTSITVRFFGNNGGRKVEWELGGRSNFTEPTEEFEPNPEVKPGEQKIRASGTDGWSVSGTQTITYPDGTVVENKYTHRYRGLSRIIEVHPCDMPNATIVCPVPVPNFVASSLDSSKTVAAGLGLSVVNGGTVPVTGASGLNGLVAQQAPAADELVPPGTVITVKIGVAPVPVTVPDLIRNSFANASAFASGLGLKVVKGADIVTTDPALVGLVASQSPASGTVVPAGSTITLSIGVASAP